MGFIRSVTRAPVTWRKGSHELHDAQCSKRGSARPAPVIHEGRKLAKPLTLGRHPQSGLGPWTPQSAENTAPFLQRALLTRTPAGSPSVQPRPTSRPLLLGNRALERLGGSRASWVVHPGPGGRAKQRRQACRLPTQRRVNAPFWGAKSALPQWCVYTHTHRPAHDSQG